MGRRIGEMSCDMISFLMVGSRTRVISTENKSSKCVCKKTASITASLVMISRPSKCHCMQQIRFDEHYKMHFYSSISHEQVYSAPFDWRILVDPADPFGIMVFKKWKRLCYIDYHVDCYATASCIMVKQCFSDDLFMDIVRHTLSQLFGTQWVCASCCEPLSSLHKSRIWNTS